MERTQACAVEEALKDIILCSCVKARMTDEWTQEKTVFGVVDRDTHHASVYV